MSEAVLGRTSGRGSVLPKWRWLTSEHPLPWLLPASALMMIFGIYPLLYALWLSLHKRNPVTRFNCLRSRATIGPRRLPTSAYGTP